jgi:hypothetical protein
LRILRTEIEDDDGLSGHASSVAGASAECKDGKQVCGSGSSKDGLVEN